MLKTQEIKIDFEKEQQTNLDEIIPPERQRYLADQSVLLVRQMLQIAKREEQKVISVTDMAYLLSTMVLNVLVNARELCGINNQWAGFCRMFHAMILRAFHSAGIQIVAEKPVSTPIVGRVGK